MYVKFLSLLLPNAQKFNLLFFCRYYDKKYNGYATLLSHDWQLCCKAELFELKSISGSEHEEWHHLVETCEVEDLALHQLPQTSERRLKVCTGRNEYDQDELFTRKNRYADTRAQFTVISDYEAHRLELPKGVKRWKIRPELPS